MTTDQVKRAVDQLISQKVQVTRFTFCGGEPVLNTDLQDMIYEVARLDSLQLGRVLTNAMPVTKAKRDKIVLPPKFKWIPNPLDDPTDPYSGKNDPTNRYRGKVHTPFWISPADIGMESNFQTCTTRGWCGIGLDSSGFSACGKAVMFGKLLGIDPTMKAGNIEDHIDTPIDDICRNCQYGLTKQENQQLLNRYKNGELSDCEDGISSTFKKAFEQHKEKQLIQLETF